MKYWKKFCTPKKKALQCITLTPNLILTQTLTLTLVIILFVDCAKAITTIVVGCGFKVHSNGVCDGDVVPQ